MGTVTRRGPGFHTKALQFLTARAETKALGTRQNLLKPALMDILAEQGEEDSAGHKTLLFPEPVNVGGESIKGLKREKRGTPYLDLEKAAEVLKERDLWEQGTTTEVIPEQVVTTVDSDKIYALHQQDLLTEEEIDSMMTTDTTYALIVVKA